MRSRKPEPLLINPQNWEELEQLLKETYTVTSRQVCSDLHISRAFFDSSIKPNLRKIYVPGIIKTKTDRYIYRPFIKELQKNGIIHGTESTYYNKNDYEDLLSSSITYTQRAKPIYLDDYIIPKHHLLPEYKRLLKSIEELKKRLMDGSLDRKEYQKLEDQLEEATGKAKNLFQEMLSETGKKFLESRVYTTNRTAAEYIDMNIDIQCFLDSGPIKGSEICGWGSTPEENMREAFEKGMIRCELRFSGKDKESSIVRYIPDPNPYIHRNVNLDIPENKILVPVKVWNEENITK